MKNVKIKKKQMTEKDKTEVTKVGGQRLGSRIGNERQRAKEHGQKRKEMKPM